MFSPSPYTISITQPLLACLFPLLSRIHLSFTKTLSFFSLDIDAHSCSRFLSIHFAVGLGGVWVEFEGVRDRELDNQHHFPLLCDDTCAHMHKKKQKCYMKCKLRLYTSRAHTCLHTLKDSCGSASQTLLNGLEALLSHVYDIWRGGVWPSWDELAE